MPTYTVIRNGKERSVTVPEGKKKQTNKPVVDL